MSADIIDFDAARLAAGELLVRELVEGIQTQATAIAGEVARLNGEVDAGRFPFADTIEIAIAMGRLDELLAKIAPDMEPEARACWSAFAAALNGIRSILLGIVVQCYRRARNERRGRAILMPLDEHMAALARPMTCAATLAAPDDAAPTA